MGVVQLETNKLANMPVEYEPDEKQKLEEIEAARKLVEEAAANVGALKANKASKEEITAAVSKLQERKSQKEALEKAFIPPDRLDVDRDGLEGLLTRRFFFCPSFSIYGGAKGFYDFGPPGCAVKSNFIAHWRQFFVLEESMLEVDTATITPEAVLKQSGHVERFNDLMVKDLNTGKYYRADHILEDHMTVLLQGKNLTEEQQNTYRTVMNGADGMSPEELTEQLRKYDIKAPETGNPISDAFPSNLMFSTHVGRGEGGLSYLRPETAQGIFVNFARLLEYNGGKIPFSAATIGMAYRNEISPRAALLRVREFTLAEIEHFVDPEDKSHPKFDSVRNVKVRFLSKRRQKLPVHLPQEKTIGEALDQKLIQNETVGYFIGRIQLFLIAVGVKEEYLRFRQHRKTEKAHYAQDCWDAEILTSYGWVECVGLADRSCYDLSRHSKGSGARMTVFRPFPQPKEVEQLTLTPSKSVIGKEYKKDAKSLIGYLSNLSEEKAAELQESLKAGSAEIQVGGSTFNVTSTMVEFNNVKKKVAGENIVPSVIEPSFGIGRIMYAMLEHSFYAREDARRTVVGLSPVIAPVKCSVLPLQQNPKFTPVVQRISSLLTTAGISNKVDDVGQSIGKRYARTDEIGIPFGVTVDFDTLNQLEESEDKATVTLRDRDSLAQIRIPISEIVGFINRILGNTTNWAEASKEYPAVAQASDD